MSNRGRDRRRNLGFSKSGANTARSRRALRPRLECLEGRELLAAAVYEYPLRNIGGANGQITKGPDNAVWFTDIAINSNYGNVNPSADSDNVGRLDLSTGKIVQYAVPTLDAGVGSIVTGPDKNLWFVEANANKLGVVNPTTGAIAEIPVLSEGNAGLQGITADSSGNLWFTETNANKIGEINATTRVIQEFAVPSLGAKPYGITLGNDGNLWFTESGTNKVGMINPTTHAINDNYTIASTGNAQAEGITVGSDGNLWIVESGLNAIAKLVPSSGAVTTYTAGLTASAGLSSITAGPDGNLWFTEASTYRLGKITTSGAVTEYSSVGYGASPLGITSANGALYFSDVDGVIGKSTTTGTSSTTSIPATYAQDPTSIVAGSDGNLWFVQPLADGDVTGQVGVVDTATHQSIEYPLSQARYEPQDIALDPANGTLWFTIQQEYGSTNAIESIDPATRVISQGSTVPTSGAGVAGITYNPTDGNLWFAEDSANSIGFINPTTGAISDKLVTLPTGADPTQIVADSKGRLWFSESGTGQVGVYDPSTQTLSQINLSSTRATPDGITVGPDGNIWVVEDGYGGYPSAASAIAVINPTTKAKITEITTTANGPIVSGSDGALWYLSGQNIGRITTATSNYAISTLPVTNANPSGITSGPDGNINFAATGTSYPNYYPAVIGTVTLSTASTATQVAVTTQPTVDVTAGKGFGLVATVENASGGVDTYYNGPVTVALGQNPGGSTLGGTVTVTALDGVADFTGLSLDQAGTGYTLAVSAAGLTSATTTPFTVALAATHLVVTTQPPPSTAAGVPFSVTVSAEDASGNVDTSFDGTLTLAIGNNTGSSTLSGVATLGAVNGVLTFTGLSLNNPGTGYTLLISDPSSHLSAAYTGAFTITPKPATHLVFTTEPPGGVVAGAPFGLTVSAENDLGQVDPSDNASITVALANPNGATLGGTVTMNLSGGVATYSDLAIDLVGPAYTLSASQSGLTSGSSTPISVISASASTFSIVPAQSGNPIVGVPFPVKVTAIDPFGNVSTIYSGTVNLSSSTDPKFVGPADYTFLPSDQGVHVFQVTLGTVGPETVTVADDSNSTVSASATIAVSPPAATVTTLTATPSPAAIGQPITLKATVTKDVATGTVTFYDGTTKLGSAPLTASGATLVYSTPLAVGAHALTAVYSGSADGTLATSQSSAFNLQVAKSSTTALASSSTSSASLGSSVTLTASIKATSPASNIPTGKVTFLDGSTVLGTGTLDGTGHATLVVPKLALGIHAITVAYAGDASDVLGTSPAIQVYVGDGMKDDFDGDGKADLATYGLDPTTHRYRFKILTSSTGFAPSKAVTFDNNGLGFGNPSSIPVAADYFGEGKAAYAIWSPDGHGYMILQAISSVNPVKSLSIDFGLTTDVPVIADVDGDGKADFGVFGYDPNLGYRYDFLLSSKNFSTAQPLIFSNYGYGFGTPGATPVVGDFDGSGHAGFGVYIPSGTGGTFTYINVKIPTGTTGAIVNPPASYAFSRTYGFSTDIPMAVDFDGDGKSDLAFYGLDPRTGRYRYDVLTSSSNFNTAKDVYFDNAGFGYGYSASIPIMADYEGNGHADFGVYQPDASGGGEYVFQDVGVGHGVVYDFGSSNDLPLSAPAFLLARKVRSR